MDRYPPQPRYRTVMTAVLAAGAAGIAASYAFIVPTPVPLGRVSIVQYIDDLGPVWPAVFGIVAAVLLGAVVAHRGYVAALSAAGAAFLGFAAALFIGALASTPIGPIVAASLSVVAAVACWVTAGSYARSKW